MGGPGWGRFLGGLADAFGSRDQRLRRERQKLERERDEIIEEQQRGNHRRDARLDFVLTKLYQIRCELENR